MKTNHVKLGSVILAGLFLIIVVAAYLYMINLINSSVEASLAANDSAQISSASRSQNKVLTDLKTETSLGRVRVKEVIVSSKDIVKLIVAIESIGPQSGSVLNLSSIDAANDSGVASSTLRNAVFHVTVQGSWAAVVKALELAETLPYAVRVERVVMDTSVLSVSAKQPKKNVWNLSFDVRAILSN